MLSEETNLYYQRKVRDVTGYIKANLNRELHTKHLSEKFGISYYHFHRILKAALNEPLATYVNRLKLDTSIHLIRYSDLRFDDIAQRIGYNDLSAFSKAFKKEFGISPQVFKKDKTLVLNTHIDYSFNSHNAFDSKLKPKTIILPDKSVFYIDIIDKYGGKKTELAWNGLVTFADNNKLWGWKPDVFSIYYDDPAEVGEYNCKTDICVASNKKITSNSTIKTKIINGGRYSMFRYKGPWDQLWKLYDKIYDEWVLKNNIVLLDKPVIEKYLSFSKTTKPENFLTEIYFPIA